MATASGRESARRGCEITLARGEHWLDDYGAAVGGTVWLDLDHMGAVGLAEVVAIDRVGDLPEVCARLGELGVRVSAAGDIGSVPGLVTGTFAHTSGEVFDLKLKSEPQPIGGTGTHLIWSDDQNDWVAVADLKPGERVRTGTGVTIVESITKRPKPEPVYNIEVDGDHVYRVGESEVLVHNVSKPEIDKNKDYGCGNMPGQGNCKRGDINSNISGGVPSGYAGHHLIGVAEANRSTVMLRACQLGYDINRQNNGLALPTDSTVSSNTGLPLHTNRHLGIYTRCVARHLRRLQRDYDDGVVTDCDLCDEIEKIEDEIRRALLAHEIWLQNADPNKPQNGQSQCTAPP